MPVSCTARKGRGALRLLSVMIILLVSYLLSPTQSRSQTELAGVYGRVTDQSGAVIADAEVEIKNVETGVSTTVKTNTDGLYTIPSLHPGRYLINVRKPGFKSVTETQVTLNVQDNVVRNFALQIGSVSETVTIKADQLNINTTDASVSTVVDRQFVENMPLNGRSFQDLLTMVPGVALVGNFGTGGNAGTGYSGEVTVNGQRTEANYFTVDGVSTNTGTYAYPGGNIGGAGISGGVPGETVLGTTQSMVSIDSLQEFRATTSTYSAEYGRTPGGQFSFTTRSGGNAWHGSIFDYFRNDVLDANNWFNNTASPQVPRQAERQNDFGGTLAGPIIVPGVYNGRDKTFFFFSYEGLRLTVPQPFEQYSVPDMALRQSAPAALQAFLNAFPVPNGGEDGLSDGLAFYKLAYSAPSSLDNTSVRIDHNFSDKLRLFGRYAYTPSSAWAYSQFPAKNSVAINVRSLTLGTTSSIGQTQTNELHFNITQNNMHDLETSTNLGGAVPFDLSNLSGPNGQPATLINTFLAFTLAYGGSASLFAGHNTNAQRQYNISDSYSWLRGAHQFKFGVDWRRLTTSVTQIGNEQAGIFFSEASVLANSADYAYVGATTTVPIEPLYHNFSLFTQDEWKTTRRLSLSLGLRWDINPAPTNLDGPSPYTVDQITNLVSTKLAPANTPLWQTDWHAFAPRVGLAYQLGQSQGHEIVLRTGFGVFYDMGNTQGSQGFQDGVGFSTFYQYFGVPFPLSATQVNAPPPSVAPPYNGYVYAFDPNLTLPYTMQWNLAVEQHLGANQSLTVGYVGSGARKLLTQFLYNPGALGNPNFPSTYPVLYITANRASSDYNALQMKYQKTLSHGVQALASYTFSHSIDDASYNFQLLDVLLRASSDFDIRHNFQTAITYDVPGTYTNSLASAVLEHWGLDTRISARSALPVDIVSAQMPNPITQQLQNFHPDLVPGQPTYIYGAQYPGGRIINYSAFTAAPPGVDGDTPRNFARGFDAVSANLALRREFPIRERLNLQFRAEAFNIFNHPNFGNIYNSLGNGPGQFGRAFNTLNNSLGGLSSLYQSGGPRSLQLMLKLAF